MKRKSTKNVDILCVILSNTVDTMMTSHTIAVGDDYRYLNNDVDDDHKRK